MLVSDGDCKGGSANGLPLVSGTKSHANRIQPAHVEPQMKKTFAPRFPLPGSTMKGMRTPMMQFQNQFEAVERATPLLRMGSWKISPMTTHAAGPHVLAKKKM